MKEMNFSHISIEAKHQLLDKVQSSTMYAIDYQLHGVRKTLHSKVISDSQSVGTDNPEMEYLYFYLSTAALIEQLRHEGLSPDIFISEVLQLGASFSIGGYLQLLGKGTKKVFGLLREPDPDSKEVEWYTMERIFGSSCREIAGTVLCSSDGSVLKIGEEDARLLAQKLAIQLGLGIGPVSAVNLLAAIELQNRMEDEQSVVTVFQDNLSDLLNIQPKYDESNRRYKAYNIAFLGYKELQKIPEAFFKEALELV
jgi:hypothetical protein